MMRTLVEAYPAAYQSLYEAKPITCAVTGTTFDAVPAPCAAVLDVSQSIDMLYVIVGSTLTPASHAFFPCFLLLVLCLSSIACY